VAVSKTTSTSRGDRAIVVAFADSLAAPEVVWSLQAAGFTVVALNRKGKRPPLRHERALELVDVTAPEDDFAGCVKETAQLVARHGSVVMPLDDGSLAVCARLAAESSAVTIIGPTGEQAELALDKRLQIGAAARAGFAIPPTTTVTTIPELRDAVDAYPVVLKAAEAAALSEGRIMRGRSFVCANADELRAAEERWQESYPLLVQPLLRGVGEGLFGLRTDDDGLRLTAHRRVRMMNPAGSGSSACVSVEVDPALGEAAARLLESVEWRGIFMLEFLRTADGTAWFMELNGRAWGSMALALRIGFDYPAWAALSELEPGFRPLVPAARTGVLCRHLGREIVHLLFALRGPASAADTDWPRPLPTLRSLARVHRGDAWYNWRRSHWRVFVADAVSTVLSQVRGRS
jgi:predicted ATP-grasp superfamily ATP-dependent carboligase